MNLEQGEISHDVKSKDSWLIHLLDLTFPNGVDHFDFYIPFLIAVVTHRDKESMDE